MHRQVQRTLKHSAPNPEEGQGRVRGEGHGAPSPRKKVVAQLYHRNDGGLGKLEELLGQRLPGHGQQGSRLFELPNMSVNGNYAHQAQFHCPRGING